LVRNAALSSSAPEALGSALPPLLIEAQRIADTVLAGTHGRRRVGAGESFWQFRDYAAGDPITRIDWRQSAKGSHIYVRETEREAAQSLYLWRDAAAAMDYASQGNVPSKRARADLLLLALATLALRGGERVGLLGAGDSRPAGNLAALPRLTAALETSVETALPRLSPQVKRHASLVLFSDFLDPLPGIAAAIDSLSQTGARGIMVQILDPAERSLPFSGRVRFEGFKGEVPELVSKAETLRRDYRARLAAHNAGLERIATRAGWTMLAAATDRPALETLTTLYLMLGGE
jgi:uncharacterized protein (DUF58 family)